MYYYFYTQSLTENKGDFMNDRKQHVIKIAHQLFIEKGFQSTSIQDILDYSGISKGTFYNYFPSKNELLIALFKSIYKKMEQERNELLIGQDPTNMEIFIKQIELQMNTNRANKLLSLFEEVFFSKDEELKDFIKSGQLWMLKWVYQRFIDMFGETKKPYLLDCSIMFLGILNHNIKYSAMANDSKVNISQIVRYSVTRIVKTVNEVSLSGDQLINPEVIDRWVPDTQNSIKIIHKKIHEAIGSLKNSQKQMDEKSEELLDFIEDELLKSKNPRKFLIESALFSLQTNSIFQDNKELQKMDEIVKEYINERLKLET
jgi:AcrR family transcriptional regulator